MSIRHQAILQCDECGDRLPGCSCLTSQETREVNTRKMGREVGWRREATGKEPLDLCVECYAFSVYMEPEQERQAA